MKKKIIISVIIPIALIIAIVVGCNLAVIYNGTGRVFDRAEDVPHNTYGSQPPQSLREGHIISISTIELLPLTRFSNSVVLIISLRAAETIAPTINSVAMNLLPFAILWLSRAFPQTELKV